MFISSDSPLHATPQLRRLTYGAMSLPCPPEAAAHSARKFLSFPSADSVLIKIDFKNAFNTIRRDCILESVRVRIPDIFNFCKLAYGDASYLSFRGTEILSQEGCQQGDPLGPLLFSLTLHPIIESLQSDLVLGYLDDLALGGSLNVVENDIATICCMASALGLTLNESKCECIADSILIPHYISLGAFPSFLSIEPINADLLGAPLFPGRHLDEMLENKVVALSRASARLSKLHAHDALLILKNALCDPKLMYTLRTSPCWGNQALKELIVHFGRHCLLLPTVPSPIRHGLKHLCRSPREDWGSEV